MLGIRDYLVVLSALLRGHSLCFPVVALLHCFLLAALVQSAPVSSPSNPSQTFKEVVERVMRLVEKIRKDVRSVHGSIINIDVRTRPSVSRHSRPTVCCHTLQKLQYAAVPAGGDTLPPPPPVVLHLIAASACLSTSGL